MKKRVLVVLFVLAVAFLPACNSSCKKPPYDLKYGLYGFDKAIVTNLITKEINEKDFYKILEDEYNEWCALLSFQVGINEETDYLYRNDSCYVMNYGLMYEVVDHNLLKLHFPRWHCSDYSVYEVVIYLDWQPSY